MPSEIDSAPPLSVLFESKMQRSRNEFHVAIGGNDSNRGSMEAPFATIQHAAEMAQPGDTITVHAGTYRERIKPPRGGLSDAQRIVYQAAPGEEVWIKGSEVIQDWSKAEGGAWKVVLPNAFFGSFNPYSDLIRGDWYTSERPNHTGAVYFNGAWLQEASSRDEITRAVTTGKTPPLWFAEVDEAHTTLWAQFPEVDLNAQLVEINVRQTVFYPAQSGINYLTVRGFNLSQAATPWAPPTAEQIGLIGTNWSKGWIIEGNTIHHSICAGIALGKYGDEFDNVAATADAYNRTIQRAVSRGWDRESVGGHIVRDNIISDCEQAGIVGSLGAIFSTISGNEIHHIHVRKLFSGAEMAGIKIHGAIDCIIAHNHVHRSCRGLWLDWMAQGAQITGNLFHENGTEDLFLEVNHGPFLVDNNIFLSPGSITTWSTGGAFVHNLIGGIIKTEKLEPRETPFMAAHSTKILGLHNNPRGDVRWINNLLCHTADLSSYDDSILPVQMTGNLFFAGTAPSRYEVNPQSFPEFDPAMLIRELVDAKSWILELKMPPCWSETANREWVTTDRLGESVLTKQGFTRPDGSAFAINYDYFQKMRTEGGPTPGPFSSLGEGAISLWVWAK